MKNIPSNSCLVMLNSSAYDNVDMRMTPKEFLKKARSGFDCDGDLYFYVPDFQENEYKMLLSAIPGIIWFAYSKEEIPHWANPTQIQIFPRPQMTMSDEPKPSAFMQSFQPGMQSLDQPQNITQQNGQMQQAPMQNQEMIQEPLNQHEDAVINDIESLLGSDEVMVDNGPKEARINLFGSSKGGTGKTFTCLISAYRYAKTHPGQKVALFDADVTDPQVAIAIHKMNPTLYDYWRNWNNGNKSFEFMQICKTQSSNFPANLDFYLAPKDYVINNDQFWLDVLNNLITSYDVLFIDSGIDYINIPLISYCYKVADRVVLVSQTSIKSTSSVLKQIHRLKGKIPSQNSNGENVYSPEDQIGPKLRLAITGYIREDKKQNDTIINNFQKNIKISALFGQLSSKISQAEFFGYWNVFDKDQKFNASLDRLLDPKA